MSFLKTTLLFLLLIIKNVFSCYPCQCIDNYYYISGTIKTGDCFVGRVTARIDKVPDNLDADIEALEMSGQTITSLTENDFEPYKKLRVINLHNTALKEVPLNIFDNASQAIVIWLNDNQLTTVQSYLFANLMYLEEISVARNNISTIEDNSFYNLPALELLDLSSNLIKTINLNFYDFGNIKYTRMHDNPWICDMHLCDVTNDATSRHIWGNDPVPTCSNLGDKRWDHLQWRDFPLSVVSSTKVVEEGKNLTLQCKYCSLYNTNIIWVVNHFGREMHISPKYTKMNEISSTSTLTINNITNEEAGNYTCRIQNCENCPAASTYVSVLQINTIPSTSKESFENINIEEPINTTPFEENSINNMPPQTKSTD